MAQHGSIVLGQAAQNLTSDVSANVGCSNSEFDKAERPTLQVTSEFYATVSRSLTSDWPYHVILRLFSAS